MPEDSQNKKNIKAHVEIVERNMKAFIVLKEFTEEQNHLTEGEIGEILKNAGVSYGIKNEVIQEIVKKKTKSGTFLIAEGTPSVTGEDATLEFYFETDKSLRPKVLEDGHLDYKDVSLVKSVAKDSVLIKKIPAGPGSKGMDVLGKVLPAVPGKDLNISVGQGTYKDPFDGTLIKSSTDGIIFYDENRRSIQVQKLYLVQKSVDYSTGNINVKSSVEIKGDVKPHFSVTTPYNVQVKGIVENATITCGGALSVIGGIIGDGKQLIEAGGDIHSSYVNNQRIRCRGSVFVTSEIRNTLIDCDDEVVVVKDTGVIIGGKIFATNKITAASIGNSYYVPTEIEVGARVEFKDKYLHIFAEKKAMQKQIEEIRSEISESNKNLSDYVNTSYMESLYRRWEECNEKLEKFRKELKGIEVDYYNTENSMVCITNTIYPGVIVKIKRAVFEVKEVLSNIKFVLNNDEIKFTNLK